MPVQQQGDALEQALARSGQMPEQQEYQFPGDIGMLLQNAVQSPVDSTLMAQALARLQRFGYDDLSEAMARGGVGNYDADPAQTLGPALQGYLGDQADDEMQTRARVFLSMLQGG